MRDHPAPARPLPAPVFSLARRRFARCFFPVILFVLLLDCCFVSANPPDISSSRLRSSFNLLVSGVCLTTASEGMDPDDLLGLGGAGLVSELRGELALDRPPGFLRVSPRIRHARGDGAEVSGLAGNERETEFMVNAWEARLEIADTLILAMGRGSLDWGMSALWSPSNPFGWAHGRQDPKQELPGTDFIRADWLAGADWTVSVIANVAEGRRREIGEFRSTTAVKADYLWHSGHGSLVLSSPGGDPQIGAYAAKSLAEAWQAYAECGVTLDYAAGLAGVRYTTLNGWTLGAEFLRNGMGDPNSPMEELAPALLGLDASLLSLAGDDDKELPGNGAEYSRLNVRLPVFRDLPSSYHPMRRHYLSAQCAYAAWPSRLSTFASYTRNLDDQSGRFFFFVEYELGDRLSLFASATRQHGNRHSEFGGLLANRFAGGLDLAL